MFSNPHATIFKILWIYALRIHYIHI